MNKTIRLMLVLSVIGVTGITYGMDKQDIQRLKDYQKGQGPFAKLKNQFSAIERNIKAIKDSNNVLQNNQKKGCLELLELQVLTIENTLDDEEQKAVIEERRDELLDSINQALRQCVTNLPKLTAQLRKQEQTRYDSLSILTTQVILANGNNNSRSNLMLQIKNAMEQVSAKGWTKWARKYKQLLNTLTSGRSGRNGRSNNTFAARSNLFGN